MLKIFFGTDILNWIKSGMMKDKIFKLKYFENFKDRSLNDHHV